MTMLIRATFLLLVLASTNQGFAENEELKAGQVRPPVPAMSEEVAREKLKGFGFTNIERLQKVGNSFAIRGMRDNQPVEVEMHTVTGAVRYKANNELIEPSTSKIPLLQDGQFKMEQQEFVRPELLPSQPEPK